jgi:hypothetical protein
VFWIDFDHITTAGNIPIREIYSGKCKSFRIFLNNRFIVVYCRDDTIESIGKCDITVPAGFWTPVLLFIHTATGRTNICAITQTAAAPRLDFRWTIFKDQLPLRVTIAGRDLLLLHSAE